MKKILVFAAILMMINVVAFSDTTTTPVGNDASAMAQVEQVVASVAASLNML